jgi:hypothetical protein
VSQQVRAQNNQSFQLQQLKNSLRKSLKTKYKRKLARDEMENKSEVKRESDYVEKMKQIQKKREV